MFESSVNRVRLGKGKTKYGLPTTQMEFEILDVNVKARQEHADNFVEMLKAAGCKEDSIEMGVLHPDGAHASGSCRMSESDGEGVVDPISWYTERIIYMSARMLFLPV